MRLFVIFVVLGLAGCAHIAPHPVWHPEQPIVIGASSYDWPVPLISDAVVDIIDQEGGAIISVEPKIGTTYVTFAGPTGRYIVEVAGVTPNTSTVTLTYPHDSQGTVEIADSFYQSLERRLGMN